MLLKNVWLRVAMLVAVVTTAFAGTAQAEDVLYKTALFGADYNSEAVRNFSTHNWTAVNDGFSVTLSGVRNHQAIGGDMWDNIAFGASNAASVGIVTTTAPVDKPLTKVVVTFSEIKPEYVNSFKLYTSPDYATWTEVGEFTQATGEQTVVLPNPAANLFYRVIGDIASTGFGGYFDPNVARVSKIEYYREADDPNAVALPVISGTQVFETSTDVTITCETAGATILYSKDNGTSWTEYTGAVNLTETTTIKAKATKEGMTESQVASKSFTLADDLVDCTWDLRTDATGTSESSIVTWTKDAQGEETGVIMSLAQGGSRTNANNHIGGTSGLFGSGQYTQFYTSQLLIVAPISGYTIVYIEITAMNNYVAGFTGNAWNNASAVTSGTTVTVTPEDGTVPVSTLISADCRATAVKVEYAPTTSPYIAVAENEVNATSEETTGTVEVVYNKVANTSAEVVVVDENENEVTWVTVSLDENKNIAYTIEANTTTEARTAYMVVVAAGYYSPVITVNQEGAPIESIAVAISSVGYSTLYYGTLNLVVPAGVTAYTYSYDGATIEESKTYYEGDVIPAGTGVVLQANAGTYEFVVTTEAGVEDPDNALKGSDEAEQTTGGGVYYALSTKGGANIGFYWMAEGGAAFTNGAHKAYLALPSNGVKGFAFGLEDDATGIQAIENAAENGAIYNLAGQRINKMQKGINIVNGKKILK